MLKRVIEMYCLIVDYTKLSRPIKRKSIIQFFSYKLEKNTKKKYIYKLSIT